VVPLRRAPGSLPCTREAPLASTRASFSSRSRRVWIRSTRTSSRAMRGPLRERPARRGRRTPFS
jgi:hypothetical protein